MAQPQAGACDDGAWRRADCWRAAATLAEAAITGFPVCAILNLPSTEKSPMRRRRRPTPISMSLAHRRISGVRQRLKPDPWAVSIDGMVEEKMTIDAADLIRQLGGMEERLYRHRCVEAWAMAVPWTGVPLAKLVNFARPQAGAKYIKFETFEDKNIAPGQRQVWYPWPYVEGLTIEEATNPLALLTTGIYGKPLPNQNRAPIRLVLPWKYGFKSIKSIRRITFTDQQPKSFWEELQPKEYGFWANVNPEFDHPRWSQKTERLLGSGERVLTLKYNGYGEWVEGLYADMPQERTLFFRLRQVSCRR